MNREKIIMYDSEEAAQLKTVTGWVSSDGRFFGKDEHLARYAGSTHKQCGCGDIVERNWVMCKNCREKARLDNYNKMPFIEYDEQIVYDDLSERYFRNSDEIEDYLAEENLTPNDLRLIVCIESFIPQVNLCELCIDIAPEDWDGEFAKDVEDALSMLNNIIIKQPAFSWTSGKIRTEYVRL